jgi:hypothetical protein
MKRIIRQYSNNSRPLNFFKNYLLRHEDEGFEFRGYLEYYGGLVSPWHDLPLKTSNEMDDFVAFYEIPRNTTAKMEVATDERYNPIM